MEMDPAGLETPLRKRRRSTTPFSSLRHPNKRARSSSIFSPSPKIVRFDPLSHGEDIDIVMESNVPESPIALRRSASVTAVSAQSPQTPGGAGIDNPFAKLSLKTPRQGKENVTPMVAKSSDHTKSAKRSARKTPGSAKSQKALPFRIKSSSSSLIDHPVTVTPVVTIPRPLLPIDWLVGSSPRIFSVHRTLLIPSINGIEPVIVAKVEGEKSMVVIEQIDKCLYTMCTLRKDLKLKDVRTVAKSAKDLSLQVQERADDPRMEIGEDEWWRGMVVRPKQGQGEHPSLQLQFLLEDEPSPQVEEPPATEENEMLTFTRHDSEFSADSGYVSSPQDPHSIARTGLISQYLEALYSTKTSLAYFAKSALSRARAEFQRLEDLSEDNSLISFLRTMVLSMDDFNTKYETFLPTMTKEDNGASTPLSISEEERRHLTQKFRHGGGRAEEISERALQREMNDLKNRETQLQIIILAELLALHEEDEDDECLDSEEQVGFETLLSSHLDRLSISGMLESDNDFSEQFTREILLPFYGSRLPRIMDMVGNPMDFISPVKQIKKSHTKSITRQSILSPRTLNRIARPHRRDISPTPLPIVPRKTLRSTPKKQKPSKFAGVLKRLQKTEVNMNHTIVPSKKVRKPGVLMNRSNSQLGSQRSEPVIPLPITDLAEVQVPATPAPKKRY